MEFIWSLLDFVLHIDKHLIEIVHQYGTLTYIILFLIIFCETGLVVTPFLPGDSLLFALGALAAKGDLNIWLIIVLLIIAAFLGNMVNYTIGRYFGNRIDNNRFVKKEHLAKTEEFYAKYGAKAVIMGRFVPFFRTFVPFVAGIGQMNFYQYTLYTLIGAVLWVLPFCVAGYCFGTIPFVKDNFSLVVLAIIALTLIPTFLGIWQEVRKQKKAKI